MAMFLAGKSELKAIGRAHLIDGDSLRIDGIEMRLSGIDAPEIRQFCTKQKQKRPCGQESLRNLKRLTAGGEVICTGWQHDRYNRLLVKCLSNGVELNRMMVRDGWAVGYGDYQSEEATAKTGKQGIWAGEFDRPQDWRRHIRAVDRWSKQ